MKKPILDIITPSATLSTNEWKQACVQARQIGFEPRLCGCLKSSYFFAQNKTDCMRCLSKAFTNKDSKIVWALRGGYGSQRLLSSLDRMQFNKWKKKLFIGYSDTTVLHDWIHKNLSWPTLHFPVLNAMSKLAPSSRTKIKSFLNTSSDVVFKNLKVLNPQASFQKEIKGKVSGGNMTMIQTQIGTPWNQSRKNQILFLEDNENEAPYSIHRALWQMQNSGVFKQLKALIFGQWAKTESVIVKEVLKPLAQQLPFPVCVGLPCGHTQKNHPLPLWTPSTLKITGVKAQLTVSDVSSGILFRP